MDIKQIHELVKLVNKSNIGELSVEKDGFKITIKQKKEPAQHFASPMIQQAPQPQQTLAPVSSASLKQDETKSTETSKAENYLTIKSPMIGTFYRQAGPGKPLFVSVGDEVEVGQVVCIIEAMKLFNEIESEVSGKIVKILVEDASPVEFDQPLFLVEP
ncbi:MAG TPA: acetyl-CoA carboxylase biotin carboxyl carrier protein [Hanamia sp.]|jgi:acetyl-CoA carboxylase biotin carboxyl carrier protein|nr:acetyl-CoA carboxylase biotin carboxyl carrier protein [Hanamia sp.]